MSDRNWKNIFSIGNYSSLNCAYCCQAYWCQRGFRGFCCFDISQCIMTKTNKQLRGEERWRNNSLNRKLKRNFSQIKFACFVNRKFLFLPKHAMNFFFFFVIHLMPQSCTLILYLLKYFFLECNRTYYGNIGTTYHMELHRPKEEKTPFVCQLTFTAAGGMYGDIVQVSKRRDFL